MTSLPEILNAAASPFRGVKNPVTVRKDGKVFAVVPMVELDELKGDVARLRREAVAARQTASARGADLFPWLRK